MKRKKILILALIAVLIGNSITVYAEPSNEPIVMENEQGINEDDPDSQDKETVDNEQEQNENQDNQGNQNNPGNSEQGNANTENNEVKDTTEKETENTENKEENKETVEKEETEEEEKEENSEVDNGEYIKIILDDDYVLYKEIENSDGFTLKKGAEIKVIGYIEDEWIYVDIDGVKGYINISLEKAYELEVKEEEEKEEITDEEIMEKNEFTEEELEILRGIMEDREVIDTKINVPESIELKYNSKLGVFIGKSEIKVETDKGIKITCETEEGYKVYVGKSFDNTTEVKESTEIPIIVKATMKDFKEAGEYTATLNVNVELIGNDIKKYEIKEVESNVIDGKALVTIKY